MKKAVALLIVTLLALSSVLPVLAYGSSVTYSGRAKDFIFAPGSEYSLTDLFPNFKGVMPGDRLTQKITVKNDASNDVKVMIYLRAIGVHEGSEEFLSQLGLKVKKADDNKMAYMFDAYADETAQLTDWVCLGMLYSGGEVDLEVILDVPTELGNEFRNRAGYLDWEFMIEEFPVEEEDPDAPQTGDSSDIGLYFVIMICAMLVLIILLIRRKKDKENEENAAEF